MKTSVKRGLILGLFAAVFIGILLLINILVYRSYTRNVNQKINSICIAILEQYPEMSENQLMELLNSNDPGNDSFLAGYGIDLNRDSVVVANQQFFRRSFLIELAALLVGAAAFAGLLRFFWRRDQRDIAEITEYIEQINRGNYALKIDNNSEDSLSILKNEVYKTTIMLREIAEGQRAEKLRLKDSLSDISHQLKTPITALMIHLENLRDVEISEEMKNQSVTAALREVNAIKALVQVLLTLSKLDANTIEFIRQKTSLEQLVLEAFGHVEALTDLKGIQVELPASDVEREQSEILCDIYWQAQGLSNIFKNAIEHAQSKVIVSLERNSVYQAIHVRNDGPAILPKDMQHIFERFYKGEGAAKDSVGIGLAMAKAIFEKDHATVSVDVLDGCTEFTIKYIQN